MNNPIKVSCKEAAKMLNLNVATIYRKRSKSLVPSVKGNAEGKSKSRVWLIAEEDLSSFCAKTPKNREKAIVFCSSESEFENMHVRQAIKYCQSKGWKFCLQNQIFLVAESYQDKLITEQVSQVARQIANADQSTKLVLAGVKDCLRRNYLIELAQKNNLEIFEL